MNLGKRMQIAGFMVSGYRKPEEIVEIQKGIVGIIEMEVCGDSAKWTYPLPDGQGGIGSTIVQPFTESFCSALTPGAVFGDSYYFDPVDGHVFFLVASCKPFDVSLLKRFLGDFGNVLDYDIMYLQGTSYE